MNRPRPLPAMSAAGLSIYSPAALLPLPPARQRMTDPHDWRSTDAERCWRWPRWSCARRSRRR